MSLLLLFAGAPSPASAGAAAVAGQSSITAAGALAGAAAVAGGSAITAQAEAAATPPISIMGGGARFASAGGASALKHRETIERWLDEALEEPEQTKGRPAKKKAAAAPAPRRDITSERRAIARPAPVSDSVAADLAPAQARIPAPPVSQRGAAAAAGGSWMSGAAAVAGAAWTDGGSELTGAGWLDHENSEDEMHALMLAFT